MENNIEIVKDKYPKAVCERALGNDRNRGFCIWLNDGWGPESHNDILGIGQTEYLAWANAVNNISNNCP